MDHSNYSISTRSSWDLAINRVEAKNILQPLKKNGYAKEL
jgi:hypothetical protein